METTGRAAFSSREARDNNNHTRSQLQSSRTSLIRELGECLQRATDMGENYDGQGEPFLQAPCGEASYSEPDGGWRLFHFYAPSEAGERPPRCVAVLKPPKGVNCDAKNNIPPSELLQSLLAPEELCYMLEHGSLKADKKRTHRCLCRSRSGKVIDVTELLSNNGPSNQQAQSILANVASTIGLKELWDLSEYQGWQIHKEHYDHGQRVSRSSPCEESAPPCASSSVASLSSFSTWNVANQLLAGVKEYVASLQGSDSERSVSSDGARNRKRKLTHVSFANGEQNDVDRPRQLRSHNGSKHDNRQEEEGNVRTVSPPAMELSSESDITTDDEHHKEEDKHGSDDEDYQEEDNSGHDEDEDDDEILASETVREPSQQQQHQQHYQTRRRSVVAKLQPPLPKVAEETTRMSTRYGCKRNCDVAAVEEAEKPPVKHEIKSLSEGPRNRRVRLRVKGMKSQGILEAVIGREGIPERRQTRRSHGIHIEAPRRFIEVDSNEGFPSSAYPHVGLHFGQSPQIACQHKKKSPIAAFPVVSRSQRKTRNKKQNQIEEVAEPETSPVRRSSRARTCRADSYEEPEVDDIDEMEKEAIQAEQDEAQEKVLFVLDTTNKLSAARLVAEYEDICVKQHGSCASLKGFYSEDCTAKEAVLNLLDECEDLNAKYNSAEEDDDIVAERQLAGRSIRTMQGRMNQEIIVRMQEKEQAELLAIEMAYQRKNKKRHTMTVNEIEWEEIQSRPAQFVTKKPRSNSRTIGSTNCPCAPKSTRTRRGTTSTNAEEMHHCSLCQNPDESDSKPMEVQDRNMVPRFRTIDVDAPSFVDRDLDEDEINKKKADDDEEKPSRKTRGSNRLRSDYRFRQETTTKLYEMKHSIDFMEKYNSGLIQEKLKDGRK